MVNEGEFLLRVQEDFQNDIVEYDIYKENQKSLYRELHGFFKFYYESKLCYISDIHLCEHISKYLSVNASPEEVNKYIQSVVKGLFTKTMKNRLFELNTFIFAGDMASDFKISELFYTEFMKYLLEVSGEDIKYKKVYAVLGNHEYWGFNNVDECVKKYKELFDKLGIVFLNNSIEVFEECRVVNVNCNDYKTLIVGGSGFAAKNKVFNAEKGLYNGTISIEEELELTNQWLDVFNEAKKTAKENGYKLVVLTHNPISDWCENRNLGNSCVYINGHTHQNNYLIDTDNDLYVLSDNQIGYENEKIMFKIANFYGVINPYVNLDNGCKETNIKDYLCFCDYIGERIKGITTITKAIEKGAKIYVVKYNDFYGFFVKSKDNIYICVGGRLKKINRNCTMWTIYKDFSRMINIYMTKLRPYRQAQEQISNFVKSFGGSGKIHGSIIDIDFYNHIMLNTDGQISYYYSPDYGLVQVYDNLYGLLKEHNQFLLECYQQLSDGEKNNALMVVNDLIEVEPELQKIDIKNSPYALSIRLSQLQRLFDKKVLRDWNNDLLNKEDIGILSITDGK